MIWSGRAPPAQQWVNLGLEPGRLLSATHFSSLPLALNTCSCSSFRICTPPPSPFHQPTNTRNCSTGRCLFVRNELPSPNYFSLSSSIIFLDILGSKSLAALETSYVYSASGELKDKWTSVGFLVFLYSYSIAEGCGWVVWFRRKFWNLEKFGYVERGVCVFIVNKNYRGTRVA